MLRMRTNNELGVKCCECGNGRKDSLELFDVCIGGQIFTICDLCNEQLLQKSLRASCKVNDRVKRPSDMAIIRRRRARSYVV